LASTTKAASRRWRRSGMGIRSSGFDAVFLLELRQFLFSIGEHLAATGHPTGRYLIIRSVATIWISVSALGPVCRRDYSNRQGFAPKVAPRSCWPEVPLPQRPRRHAPRRRWHAWLAVRCRCARHLGKQHRQRLAVQIPHRGRGGPWRRSAARILAACWS